MFKLVAHCDKYLNRYGQLSQINTQGTIHQGIVYFEAMYVKKEKKRQLKRDHLHIKTSYNFNIFSANTQF